MFSRIFDAVKKIKVYSFEAFVILRQLTNGSLTFQIIANNFRTIKTKVVKVAVVDDVSVALKYPTTVIIIV